MNPRSDLDSKIDELKQFQPSPKIYNNIGDLYLKKGDKKSAVDYFYRSAKSYDDRSRAIAIYKKILSIAPFEIEAYEKIIDLCAKEGLIAEEIKYLLYLARLYRNRRDFEKATNIYSRIHDLDPANEEADSFFKRGKITEEAAVSGAQESAPAEAPPDAYQAEEEQKSGERITITEPWLAELEQAERSSLMKKKLILIIPAVLLVLGLAGGVLFYVSGKGTKPVSTTQLPAPPKEKPSAGDPDSLWKNNTTIVKSGKFDIHVTRLPAELLTTLPPSVALSKQDMTSNRFYLIQVYGRGDCVPELFARQAVSQVSFLSATGAPVAPVELTPLRSPAKIISKPDACGKKTGISFMQFYSAHPQAVASIGMSIRGLEPNPITVMWN